jgi:FkbM family methyltransferase
MASVLRAVANASVPRTLVQSARAARLLRPRRRVLAGQARRGTVGCYALRRSGSRVHVRHSTRDLDILTEVFGRGCYEPPEPVPLDGALRVADVGGNVGMFGLFALERWDLISLRSYEPDPANLELLRATAAPHAEWTVTGAAVSNRAGTLRFAAGMFSESRAAADDEHGIDVPLVDLFDQPAVDLLKLDIEGGEWAILTDPRLPELGARVIVMEWHRRDAPGGDPPSRASELLAAGGYAHHRHGDACASNGLLWAWR